MYSLVCKLFIFTRHAFYKLHLLLEQTMVNIVVYSQTTREHQDGGVNCFNAKDQMSKPNMENRSRDILCYSNLTIVLSSNALNYRAARLTVSPG